MCVLCFGIGGIYLLVGKKISKISVDEKREA